MTSQFASLDWFPFNLVFLWFGVIEHGQCILYSMVHDILYLQNIKIQLIKSALGRLIAIQPKKNREGKKKVFGEASSLSWNINKKGLSDTLYGRKIKTAQ